MPVLVGEDFSISILDKPYREMNPLNFIDELVREYAVTSRVVCRCFGCSILKSG